MNPRDTAFRFPSSVDGTTEGQRRPSVFRTVIWVAGGSRTGRALAEALDAEGTAVVITGRDHDPSRHRLSWAKALGQSAKSD